MQTAFSWNSLLFGFLVALHTERVVFFGEWLSEVLRVEIFVRVLRSSRVNRCKIIQTWFVVSKLKVLLFALVAIFSSVLQK